MCCLHRASECWSSRSSRHDGECFAPSSLDRLSCALSEACFHGATVLLELGPSLNEDRSNARLFGCQGFAGCCCIGSSCVDGFRCTSLHLQLPSSSVFFFLSESLKAFCLRSLTSLGGPTHCFFCQRFVARCDFGSACCHFPLEGRLLILKACHVLKSSQLGCLLILVGALHRCAHIILHLLHELLRLGSDFPVQRHVPALSLLRHATPLILPAAPLLRPALLTNPQLLSC